MKLHQTDKFIPQKQTQDPTRCSQSVLCYLGHLHSIGYVYDKTLSGVGKVSVNER